MEQLTRKNMYTFPFGKKEEDTIIEIPGRKEKRTSWGFGFLVLWVFFLTSFMFDLETRQKEMTDYGNTISNLETRIIELEDKIEELENESPE